MTKIKELDNGIKYEMDDNRAMIFPGGFIVRRAADCDNRYYVFMTPVTFTPAGDFYRTREGFETMAHCDWDQTMPSLFSSPYEAVKHIVQRTREARQ